MANSVETFEQLNDLHEWMHGMEKRYAEDSRIFYESYEDPAATMCVQKSLAFYMCAMRLEEVIEKIFG